MKYYFLKDETISSHTIQTIARACNIDIEACLIEKRTLNSKRFEKAKIPHVRTILKKLIEDKMNSDSKFVEDICMALTYDCNRYSPTFNKSDTLYKMLDADSEAKKIIEEDIEASAMSKKLQQHANSMGSLPGYVQKILSMSTEELLKKFNYKGKIYRGWDELVAYYPMLGFVGKWGINNPGDSVISYIKLVDKIRRI